MCYHLNNRAALTSRVDIVTLKLLERVWQLIDCEVIKVLWTLFIDFNEFCHAKAIGKSPTIDWFWVIEVLWTLFIDFNEFFHAKAIGKSSKIDWFWVIKVLWTLFVDFNEFFHAKAIGKSLRIDWFWVIKVLWILFIDINKFVRATWFTQQQSFMIKCCLSLRPETKFDPKYCICVNMYLWPMDPPIDGILMGRVSVALERIM